MVADRRDVPDRCRERVARGGGRQVYYCGGDLVEDGLVGFGEGGRVVEGCDGADSDGDGAYRAAGVVLLAAADGYVGKFEAVGGEFGGSWMVVLVGG